MSGAPWQQTYTGKQYFYLEPTPDMICIEDIAHSLAGQARFLRHTNGDPYSVGQHSLLASRWIAQCVTHEPGERRKLELLALLHDASETYLGDVSTPLKPILIGYKALERVSMQAVAMKFGLSPVDFDDPRVHHVDARMLATEKRDLMGPEPAPWIELPAPFTMRITPEPPHIVEEEFLARFRHLTS